MQQQLTQILPRLRRFAYSLTGELQDADDLVQATLEKVLHQPAMADLDLQKWVFRVCRNQWIDEFRSRKVRTDAAQKPELQQSQVVDGERQQHANIQLDKVHRAMEQLPNEQRSVLSMIAVQGMAYKDVAAALDMPIGTVMSRLSRARAQLVDLLKPATGELPQ